MTTPTVLGATREFFFAPLSNTNAVQSFLEDPTGTTVSGANTPRSRVLGDPISTGPNSVWHQLSWEGGELQDVWSDKAMYQKGDVDVIQWSGKARQWGGFTSFQKDPRNGAVHSVAMCEGSRADVAPDRTALYVGERDHHPGDVRAPKYRLWRVNAGYARNDPKAHQYLKNFTEPIRILTSAQGDDIGGTGVITVCTATKMYQYVEKTNLLTQDTSAPATTANNYEYGHDSAVFYANAMFYLHGNRLMKRVGKPPFGVIGTHTVAHIIRSAKYCQGATVWNSRIWFGSQFPNGKAAVWVSDGATTVKAFDFPARFYLHKMVAVAGSLYVIGNKKSYIDGADGRPTTLQQVWRYDGRSLKLLWQDGKPGDGEEKPVSDICEFNGWVCWGRQGTPLNGSRANLVFYDPVNDAIVRGPGLDLYSANTGSTLWGRGLWIFGIHPWHGTLATWFKDSTDYTGPAVQPSMLAVMRQENYVKNDLRWPVTGAVGQFQATTAKTSGYLYSSEYHGEDDVAMEKKVWLSTWLRVKLSGNNAKVDVYAIMDANEDGTGGTTALIGTATNDGTGGWQLLKFYNTVGVPSAYMESRKIQYKLEFYNDSTNYDSPDYAIVDDIAVEYIVAPRGVRQWQIRIPLTDKQPTLHNVDNPLDTADDLGDALQNYYFQGKPFMFWPPRSDGTVPTTLSGSVQVRATDFHRQQARLATDEGASTGTVSLTLVENVYV